MLLLDLDRFKAVNDELGHETGDAVIVACAQALRERTRGYDELVRLGGDEFVVVAPVPDVLDALPARRGDARPHRAALQRAAPARLGPHRGDRRRGVPRRGASIRSRCSAPPTSRSTARRTPGRDGVVVAEPAVADVTARAAFEARGGVVGRAVR